jgi:hypothetical protein
MMITDHRSEISFRNSLLYVVYGVLSVDVGDTELAAECL